jgi:hypothetical protein
MAEGFELTILETHGEQDECPVCYRPIYKSECDGVTDAHTHKICGTSRKEFQPPRSPSDPYPEPGLRLNRCGHVLGYTCAMDWFTRSNTCPMCRAELFFKEEPTEETDGEWWDWDDESDGDERSDSDEESDSDDESESTWFPGDVQGVPGEYHVRGDSMHWRPITPGQESIINWDAAEPYRRALCEDWIRRMELEGLSIILCGSLNM